MALKCVDSLAQEHRLILPRDQMDRRKAGTVYSIHEMHNGTVISQARKGDPTDYLPSQMR